LLGIYFTVPMLICLFTVFSVFQTATRGVQNHSTINGTDRHVVEYIDGYERIIGLVFVFVFTVFAYIVRNRHTRSDAKQQLHTYNNMLLERNLLQEDDTVLLADEGDDMMAAGVYGYGGINS
jgi:UDP-N-acetylmuramyl pentapeptide phosphotransferase/UDP-N-acetylglucosamine-1-phosphate transferase